MDVNNVTIVGRLTRDPESRQAGASKVVSIALAVKRVYYVEKEKKEEVAFIDVEVWGQQGEVVEKYTKKGSELGVIGRLKQDSWEKDGQKRTKLLVVAEKVSLGSKPAGADSESHSAPATENRAPAKSFQKKGFTPKAAQQPVATTLADDEIPF